MDAKIKFIALVLITIVFLEVVVRLAGHQDADGDFYFLQYRLKPYNFPTQTISQKIGEYDQNPDGYLKYDGALGWSIRPNSKSKNLLYASNSAGLRESGEVSIEKDSNTVRIAAFGDSFVHADDVSNLQTWESEAQTVLQQRGVNAEVLNFGVPGYGIDQAYLRYQSMGKNYSPDIVLIGFQPENCFRNVNINRVFYTKSTDIPLFKPRFVLGEGESLRLVDSPTPEPQSVESTIAGFDSSPLAKWEYYYHESDYDPNPARSSKLFSLVEFLASTISEKWSRSEEAFYSMDSEGGMLCYSVLKQFESEAKNNGSQVYIIHFPFEKYVKKSMQGENIPYAALLEKIKSSGSNVIDLEPLLEKKAKEKSLKELFIPHYSPELNQSVGTCVGASIDSAGTRDENRGVSDCLA